ncbi:hypothetical protein [Auraticoccus monumenti]|uniref:hypothetical protein n=1 Tax=Auraticoccus monumenti TaxID=675864 RepID=UPI000B84CE0D|nr:hypothetical protein [Auraticoccus monumenti]
MIETSFAEPEPRVALLSSELSRLGAAELSDLVAAHTVAVRRAEATVLVAACVWADLHPGVDRDAARMSRAQRSAAERYGSELAPVGRRGRADELVDDVLLPTGGEGTPEVSCFALAEFAVLRQVSIAAGHALVADALDLRHRLPRLYEAAGEGLITVAMARRAARATRHLPPALAEEVDGWLAESVRGIGWGRFCTLLEAAVIEVDPQRAADRAAAAAAAQDVWSRRDEDGLATLVARVEAGDAAVVLDMVNRIADVLEQRTGERLTAGQRRAKALRVLASPLQALALLMAHSGDADDALEPHDARDAHDADGARGSHDVDGVGDPHDVDGAGDPYDANGARDPHDAHGARDTHTARGAEDALSPLEDDPTRPAGATAERPVPVPVPLAGPGPGPGSGPHRSDHEAGALERDLAVLRRALTSSGTTVDAWITRAWDVGAPRATLVFHLADRPAVVRPEHDGGPITLEQLTDHLSWSGARVTVQPVVDPAHLAPVDGYEIGHRLRRAVRTRHPASVFPWSPAVSSRMDLDHTVPYVPGRPGQTGVDTLGPLGRREHRVKTFGAFSVRQPLPGVFLWRTPTGHRYLVTNQGTTHLGRDGPSVSSAGVTGRVLDGVVGDDP